MPLLVLSYKAFGNKPGLGKGLEKVPQDSFLVTTNVVGLYANITHKEGILALKNKSEEQTSSKSLLMMWLS